MQLATAVAAAQSASQQQLHYDLPPVGKVDIAPGFHGGLRPVEISPSGETQKKDALERSSCSTVRFLLTRNLEVAERFTAEPFFSSRERYLAKHPTQIVAFKCMDGRLNLPIMSRLPPGIIRPFRNIGGVFDLGWPLLKEAAVGFVEEGTARGQQTIALCTYHFAKGHVHRGCAGNNYDNNLSIARAQRLVDQFHYVFSDAANSAAVPVLMGIETDEDAFVFHGIEGRTLEVAHYAAPNPDDGALRGGLRRLFPGWPHRLIEDLLPLASGNALHIHELRQMHRPSQDIEHREVVIAVGRGFDWLHMPNKALIIGPFAHDWTDSVATAGKIVLNNIKAGRADASRGVVLITSTASRKAHGSYDWRMNQEKAMYLSRVSAEALQQHVPELLQLAKVHLLPGVLDGRTLRFWPLEPQPVLATAAPTPRAAKSKL